MSTAEELGMSIWTPKAIAANDIQIVIAKKDLYDAQKRSLIFNNIVLSGKMSYLVPETTVMELTEVKTTIEEALNYYDSKQDEQKKVKTTVVPYDEVTPPDDGYGYKS